MTRLKVLTTALAVIAGLLALASPAQAALVTLSGAVTVGGSPVSSGEVLFYENCDDYADGRPSGESQIEANGSYSVELDPGNYLARIVPTDASGAVNSWHDGVRKCTNATPFTVNTTTTKELRAEVGVPVTGRATNTEGIPVSSGRVVFFASCRGFNRGLEKGFAGLESDGSYATTLPVGDYKVWIDPGTASHAVDSWNSAFTSCADTPVVTVRRPSVNVPLTARSGTLLTGTVSAGGYTPVAVNILFYESCEDVARDRPAGYTWTDDGDYEVSLVPGEYKVRITPNDYTSPIVNGWSPSRSSCALADTITVAGTTDTEPLTALMGSLVTGTVRNSEGVPLNNGQVKFYTDCLAYRRGDVTAMTSVGDQGAYEVRLAAGLWLAHIEPQGEPAIDSFNNASADCKNATPVDTSSFGAKDLVADAGLAVSGIVRNNVGQAAQGGTVTFRKNCLSEQSTAASFTASRYETRLAPGTYYAMITSADPNVADFSWNGGTTWCEDSTQVTITESASDVDLTGLAVLTVSGTLARTTSTGTMPLAAGSIEFYADCEDPISGIGYAQNGIYTARVPVGTYRVLIQPESSQALPSWHNAKASCEKADLVTITGPTVGLQLVARSASILSGEVRTAGGPVDSGMVRFFTSCTSGGHEASPIDEGAYRASLSEGTYYILIEPEDAGGAASWNGAVASCAQSTPVTVRGATTQDLLAAGATPLTGSVTVSGQPVGGGTVSFFSDCNAAPLETRSILRDGTYEAALAPGRYRVWIQASYGSPTVAFSWHDAARTCGQATEIEVGQAPVKRNLRGLPTQQIMGSVDSSNGPVDLGSVYFFSGCEAGGNAALVAISDFSGGDYIAQLPPGDHYAWLYPYAGAAVSWNGAKTACAQSTPVNVDRRGTYDLEAGYGVRVSGTVSSAAGPAGAGSVEFRRTCDDSTTSLGGFTEFRRTRYTLRVMPGTYRVEIVPWESSGAITSWHSAKKTCAEADAVTVSGDGALDLRALKRPDPPGPGPGPGPTPGPVPAAQSAKKPPAKLKKGKKARLAKKTAQGSRLTWRSTTRKVCTVKKNVVTARKKGVCKVSARASAVNGFTAYGRSFRIRVR